MKKIHADIKIYGIVQGVGFRPFVHKAALSRGLSGKVCNTSFGAEIEIEGDERVVDAFCAALKEDAPPLALVEKTEVAKSDVLSGFSGFCITESARGKERRTLICPDIAVCDDCLRELYDTHDRRYRYPFINCTNCGPRFTITRDIPYDRKNTTMAPFLMCEKCAEEYGDIEDRRYHAQPDCCEVCGPRLTFCTADGKETDGDAITHARESLLHGKVVAVKGLGGYHLACRADDEGAVRRLRERKRRDEKPFAVMCRDLASARILAEISADEERELSSPRRPIVLLKKREKNAFSYLSENARIGIMLPYTPIHHLLLDETLACVVMTSANISDLPIVYQDSDARQSLSGIADALLYHNREIHTRCDDSLMWVYDKKPYFARRSRGYVPYPITLDREMSSVLACGAEQKASFVLTRGHHAFPSRHIGDLKNLETLDDFEAQIAHFENIFDIKPAVLACDMHPDYMSASYARERAEREGIPLISVQHHYAHMCSCMADNGYDGKCIGIIWDGTGYGSDGKIWGAEFLAGDFSGFLRRGTIRPVTLPGGDRASREISRIGASLLLDSGLPCDDRIAERIIQSGINCPSATSMGRLFDGVAAILGICTRASFEGQGATLLEAKAEDGIYESYPYTVAEEDGMYVVDWREMIRALYRDRKDGRSIGEISAVFMNTLSSFATETAKKIACDTGIQTVALSGGTFQNMYLLERIHRSLEGEGFYVLIHRRVSPNDEGISLGQAVVAQNQK
ncbi:MAG: carbamoyltransferase HypF [Oscillospiraceae bacterium]|nr:carbamoyltransferase HypF [Oscillospiraceae bacterium]